MPRYFDLDNASGVDWYEEGPDRIDLTFKDGSVYRYTHAAPGRAHVAEMKRLARRGKGLLTYVNQHVRNDYARRIR